MLALGKYMYAVSFCLKFALFLIIFMWLCLYYIIYMRNLMYYKTSLIVFIILLSGSLLI